MENNLLARVYDLILNEQTSEEERSSLVEFKNAIESGKDFQLETMKLAETLRQLALRKFKHKEKNLVMKLVSFIWTFLLQDYSRKI